MWLSYKDLVIRNATVNDALLLSSWWNNGTIMEHAGFPNGLTILPKQLSESLLEDSDETRRRLIIELNDIPIGEMNYKNIGNKIASIGINICQTTQQEKGYGRLVLSLLIDYLFNQAHYQKIVLDTNFNNVRAQHVYELLGFVKLRIKKDAWQNQLGEWQSTVEYELYQSQFIDYTKIL